MGDDPLSAYRALIRAGTLERDPAQELAAEKLNLLHRKLGSYRPPDVSGGGLFSRLGFGQTPAEPPQAATRALSIFHASDLVPVQELFRVFRMRAYCVVPL